MDRFNESSMFFCFNSLPKKTAGIRIRIGLKDRVDPGRLREALALAVKRNPFFRLKPCLDEQGNIRCTVNTSPVKVYPEDGTYVLLGTGESEGYLFRIRYTEDTIVFFCSHILSDGRGAISFLTSVLYHYFTMAGKTITKDGSFVTAEDPEDPKEITGVFEDLPEGIKPLEELPSPKEIFSVPGPRVLMDTDRSRFYEIRFPGRQLMEISKENGTTPFPLFAVLISDSLRKAYDTGSSAIRVSAPVDMRRFLNGKSLTNYSLSVETDLDSDLYTLSKAERIRYVTEDIGRKTSEEEMLKRAAFSRDNAKGSMEFPFGNEEICRGMMMKRMGKKDTFSFLLTNIGLLRFPKEIRDEIRSFDLVSPSVVSTPSISLFTFGEDSYLCMVANFEEDSMIKEILASMKEAGFDAQLTENGYFTDDSLLTYRFEKQ